MIPLLYVVQALLYGAIGFAFGWMVLEIGWPLWIGLLMGFGAAFGMDSVTRTIVGQQAKQMLDELEALED